MARKARRVKKVVVISKSKGRLGVYKTFGKKKGTSKYNTAWRRRRAEKRLSNPGMKIRY